MKIDRDNTGWGSLKWWASDVHSGKENRKGKYKVIGHRIKISTT